MAPEVHITIGGVRRTIPVEKAQTQADGQPRVMHASTAGHSLVDKAFNVHMHVSVSIQVVTATPCEAMAALHIFHSSVRELVDALSV